MLFIRKPLLGLRLFALLVLTLVLLISDYRGQYLATVRAKLSLIVAPIQYLVNWPTQMADAINTNLTSRQALLKENKTIRTKQLVLETQLQQMHVLEQENQQLRALLNAVPRTNSQRFVVAQLLAITSDASAQQMILDKGSQDQVYVGQAVLDAQGIMGQVIEVSPLTSRILLISDPRSGVPIQNTRNGWRGIVAGIGSLDKLSLLHVPQTEDIKVGDLLVSSGLGQRFPVGYPVGKVLSVAHYPGEHFATVMLEPCARLNSSRQVLLIWPEITPRLIEAKPVKPLKSELPAKSNGHKAAAHTNKHKG